MNTVLKTNIVLLLFTLALTSCSSTPPAPQRDPYNDADSQRTGASQSQSEMSREMSK